MSFVYLHCRPTGEPFYVGKGTELRANSFIPRNQHYGNVVYKYGYDNILVGKIECSSDEIAFDLEKGIIKLLRSQGRKLSNINNGGEGFDAGNEPWNKGSVGVMKAWSKGLKLGPQKTETVEKRALALKGYKHVEKTCPKCGSVGAGGSMKRWHFDNCKGLKPTHKARTTIDGIRVFLGYFHTKEQAEQAILNAHAGRDVKISI